MIMVLFCLAISLRKKYRSITHRFLDLSPFSRLISLTFLNTSSTQPANVVMRPLLTWKLNPHRRIAGGK